MTSHRLEVEFVVNEGHNNVTCPVTMDEDQYTRIKDSLNSAKKKRGRPAKSKKSEVNRQQIKEYNAQIRKEVKMANFDAKGHQEDELSQDFVSEAESDDDEFIDGLKEKQKEPEIDMEKLTKRQRQFHMAKKNLGERG